MKAPTLTKQQAQGIEILNLLEKVTAEDFCQAYRTVLALDLHPEAAQTELLNLLRLMAI